VNAEQIIAEIEWLEHLFSLSDNRTALTCDSRAANRKIAAIERLEKLFRLPDKRPLQISDWKGCRGGTACEHGIGRSHGSL
jgi:hypothetical protein